MVRKTVYKPVQKPKPIFAGGTLTPPKFVPTYYEWLFKRGQPILKHVSTGTATIYSVPDNSTFYLTNIGLTGWYMTPSSANQGSGLYVLGTEHQTLVYWDLMYANPAAPTTYQIPTRDINFPFPIPFTSGTSFRAIGTAQKCTAVIVGFLVKNADIPQF